MEFYSACLGISAPKVDFFHNRQSLVSTSGVRFRNQRELSGLGRFEKKSCLLTLKKRVIVYCSSSSTSNGKLEIPVKASPKLPAVRFDAVEPFRGKSGSVSFHGLTHQLVEEKKLVSAPFDVDKGSFLWILAPIALISSLILPQFFLSEIIELIFDESTIAEVVSSVIFEILFYIGLGSFLFVTDRVQRPYLEFSAKRWGLITGLRGYLTTSFFTMGLKVMVPLFACYVNFPMIGLPAVAAVLPFLVGCLAQLGFETLSDRRGSSCWPIIPIVFEVYRLYQLTRAAHFLQRLLFALKDLPSTSQLAEKGGALFSMILCFQVLGLVCVWSLVTFLLRLFPSRPVAENY